MKTRKQAEARAMELYEPSQDALTDHIRLLERQAFLQCYDEMTKHKDLSKTCGYCVKPSKKHQKELLCEMMHKDEDGKIVIHLKRKTASDISNILTKTLVEGNPKEDSAT